jgi:photosynthetic reaction center cytochrome c subunit
MMHMSSSLSVNCTYCHNTRAVSNWSQSTPQRTLAWHAIRMVRDLNGNYIEPLTTTFPANRLGPTGDAPKLNCATCHNGQSKPLAGAHVIDSYPELARPTAEMAAVPPTPETPEPIPEAPASPPQ